MPYTPPSHQSPASTGPSSPSISRTSSFDDAAPRSPAGRPAPPRSMSSASYLHKHRRSPSMTTPDDASTMNPISEVHDFANLRQHPPPVNNLRIPTGAVISPPDSSENSDGDEGQQRGRGPVLEKNWDQLHEAVRCIPLRRESSPVKTDHPIHPQSMSEPVSQSTSPTALTPEARKISHSRSSTETKILVRTAFADVIAQGSDDSEEDENAMSKPALVRKKSGELVKPALRPSSRRRYSSMPGTPTYSKSVHFNDNDNQTRHFLQVDKPIAVSAGTSPVETYDNESEFPFESENTSSVSELEIQMANFPSDTPERRAQPVYVERLYLSTDKQNLIGTCVVRNLAFQKSVAARFTLDYWKTTSEVTAEYSHDLRHPLQEGCDRFNFQIKLSDQANIVTKTMFLCIRYNVGGQEFWDNNDSTNYQIDFKVEQKRHPAKSGPTAAAGHRSPNAIPRSKHTSPALSSEGKRDSHDDDFLSGLETKSSYDFGSLSKLLGESAGSIKLKPKTRRPMAFSASSTPAANGLGSRYDFGTSLSAALSTAHEKLGRQSGIMYRTAPPPKSTSGGSYFPSSFKVESPKQEQPVARPEALTTDRPAMGSDQYRDLVQKFCYFTPGSGKNPVTPQPSATQSPAATGKPGSPSVALRSSETDQDVGSGAESDSVSSTAVSSGTASPTLQLDGSSDNRPPIRSPLSQRPTSPGAELMSNRGSRSQTSVTFGLPYRAHKRDGYLSETPTPTAIRG